MDLLLPPPTDDAGVTIVPMDMGAAPVQSTAIEPGETLAVDAAAHGVGAVEENVEENGTGTDREDNDNDADGNEPDTAEQQPPEAADAAADEPAAEGGAPPDAAAAPIKEVKEDTGNEAAAAAPVDVAPDTGAKRPRLDDTPAQDASPAAGATNPISSPSDAGKIPKRLKISSPEGLPSDSELASLSPRSRRQRLAMLGSAAVVAAAGTGTGGVGAVPPPENVASVGITLLCPDEAMGMLIGRSGAALRAMREASGAEIGLQEAPSVPPGIKDRGVWLRGTLDQVEIGQRIILEKLATRRENAPALSAAEQDFMQYGDVPPDQSPPEVVRTVRFIVPNAQCGAIIGRGGQGVKELEETSGCRVKVSLEGQAPPGAPDDRIVYLTGTAAQRTAALTMLGNNKRLVGRLATPDDKETAVLFVPMRVMSHLLGHHNAGLAALQQETGADVSVPSAAAAKVAMGTNEQKILLVGSPAVVARARKVITERVTAWAAADVAAGGDGGAADTGPECSIKLALPNELMGHMIGRQGSFVKLVKEKTGCILKVMQNAPTPTICGEFRPVVLVGTLPQMLQAEYLIYERIAGMPDRLRALMPTVVTPMTALPGDIHKVALDLILPDLPNSRDSRGAGGGGERRGGRGIGGGGAGRDEGFGGDGGGRGGRGGSRERGGGRGGGRDRDRSPRGRPRSPDRRGRSRDRGGGRRSMSPPGGRLDVSQYRAPGLLHVEVTRDGAIVSVEDNCAGAIIGRGGSTIRRLIAESDARIDVQNKNLADGSGRKEREVVIRAPNERSTAKALRLICDALIEGDEGHPSRRAGAGLGDRGSSSQRGGGGGGGGGRSHDRDYQQGGGPRFDGGGGGRNDRYRDGSIGGGGGGGGGGGFRAAYDPLEGSNNSRSAAAAAALAAALPRQYVPGQPGPGGYQPVAVPAPATAPPQQYAYVDAYGRPIAAPAPAPVAADPYRQRQQQPPPQQQHMPQQVVYQPAPGPAPPQYQAYVPPPVAGQPTGAGVPPQQPQPVGYPYQTATAPAPAPYPSAYGSSTQQPTAVPVYGVAPPSASTYSTAQSGYQPQPQPASSVYQPQPVPGGQPQYSSPQPQQQPAPGGEPPQGWQSSSYRPGAAAQQPQTQQSQAQQPLPQQQPVAYQPAPQQLGASTPSYGSVYPPSTQQQQQAPERGQPPASSSSAYGAPTGYSAPSPYQPQASSYDPSQVQSRQPQQQQQQPARYNSPQQQQQQQPPQGSYGGAAPTSTQYRPTPQQQEQPQQQPGPYVPAPGTSSSAAYPPGAISSSSYAPSGTGAAYTPSTGYAQQPGSQQSQPQQQPQAQYGWAQVLGSSGSVGAPAPAPAPAGYAPPSGGYSASMPGYGGSPQRQQQQ